MWLAKPSSVLSVLAFGVVSLLYLSSSPTTAGASVVGVAEIEQNGQGRHPWEVEGATNAGDRINFAASETRSVSPIAAARVSAAAAAAVKPTNDENATTERRLGASVTAADGLPQRRAFATLLYSDFVVGARALGQSLRESGTTADIVVLVTPDVQQETRDMLAQDGWIVRPVEVEANPNQNFQSRLVFVYTKLLIVEMEAEYDRIVFLDADTLVLENIDELFECEPFCAVMRHSELLNSGVVVVTPSKELYSHMHGLIGELDSYTGGDQGFFNSFYPYFAACPAFEPYPVVGSRLPGPGSPALETGGGVDYRSGTLIGGKGDGRGLESDLVGEENGEAAARVSMTKEASLVLAGRGRQRGLGRDGGEPALPKRGWGCKRLPTRYNGDWPLLFVDGDLQMVQGKEAGPEAPSDWKQRKKVKILHFTFGTAKPWDWWTYPFLPYVDLWLETFYRLDGRIGRTEHQDNEPHVIMDGGAAHKGSRGRGSKRPRWSGVFGQAVYGLAPLLVVAVLSRALRRSTATWKAFRRGGTAFARRMIPVSALNARSLFGNLFNLSVGLVLALSAAVLAFKAVPTARLGAARPEAAWAFFWGRATALMALSEGCYLLLVALKAHQVSKVPPAPPSTSTSASGAPYSSIVALERDAESNSPDEVMMMPTPVTPPAVGVGSAGAGRRCLLSSSSSSAVQSASLQTGVLATGVGVGGGSSVGGEGTGKPGGTSVGGRRVPWPPALTETVAHLALLSVMVVSLVSAPLWVGLNGSPASLEIVPGVARLVTLLVVFTFSAVRLPPMWAAHAWACARSGTSSGRSGGGGDSRSSGSERKIGCGRGTGNGGSSCGRWNRGHR